MKRIIHILLVEDDTLDQMEVKRTLDKRNIVYRMSIATNGEEALKFLLESEGISERPDIILLDLNMPKMNGFEVTAAIRNYPAWRDIKLFILTTSDEHTDKVAALKLGVSGFITKPLKLTSPSSIDAFNLMIDLMNM